MDAQRDSSSKEPRKDLKLSRRCEKDIIAACDRRILEFPLSMSPNAVAETLKAEGWYGPKTTVYYIEYRVRRLRAKDVRRSEKPENAGQILANLPTPKPWF